MDSPEECPVPGRPNRDAWGSPERVPREARRGRPHFHLGARGTPGGCDLGLRGLKLDVWFVEAGRGQLEVPVIFRG